MVARVYGVCRVAVFIANPSHRRHDLGNTTIPPESNKPEAGWYHGRAKITWQGENGYLDGGWSEGRMGRWAVEDGPGRSVARGSQLVAQTADACR